MQHLKHSKQVYLAPMQQKVEKQKSYLTKDMVKTLFSDIVIIHAFNQKLLGAIQDRVQHWSVHQKLGDIFLEIVRFPSHTRGFLSPAPRLFTADNQLQPATNHNLQPTTTCDQPQPATTRNLTQSNLQPPATNHHPQPTTTRNQPTPTTNQHPQPTNTRNQPTPAIHKGAYKFYVKF
jgi:hypothetical protein